MERLFKKNELLFSIILIIVYVLITSIMQNNFGIGNKETFFVLLIMSSIILFFVIKNNLSEYLGLTLIKDIRNYLYFIPLLIIILANLWTGITIKNTVPYIITYILNMCLVGFIEETIFRGFLFRAIEKENQKEAIIITSITFGVGHIVDLLNGAEILTTLLQILYAISIGYLFIIIFIKSKSIIPCIICHFLLNALNIFSVEKSILSEVIISIILIIISTTYAIYLKKNKNLI